MSDKHPQVGGGIFCVIGCPDTPVALGLPWLVLQNPQLDWTIAKITSWSSFHHTNFNITEEDNNDDNGNIPPMDSASNDNVAINYVQVCLCHLLN